MSCPLIYVEQVGVYFKYLSVTYITTSLLRVCHKPERLYTVSFVERFFVEEPYI